MIHLYSISDVGHCGPAVTMLAYIEGAERRVSGGATMDYEELGRFLARYSPEEWQVFMAGHCGMTQSSNVFDPDRLCRGDRVPGYVLCEWHLHDARDNYGREDVDLRIPPSVTEWLSY